MIVDTYGQMVLDEQDIMDLMMRGRDITHMRSVLVDPSVDLQSLVQAVEDPGQLLTWTFPEGSDIAVPEFDHIQQGHWFMPDHYKEIDVAAHVLGLCEDQHQLQRCGQELMMYQDRDLFDLLRYLIYLVDVMRDNHVIWGVGRGSSVASYVLYKIGVHRIDSLYYDLDPGEFLR